MHSQKSIEVQHGRRQGRDGALQRAVMSGQRMQAGAAWASALWLAELWMVWIK